MSTKLKGIRRYTRPQTFPVYGILLAYIIIWIFRLFFDLLLFQIDLFCLGPHGVTIADLLIIGGALVGIILWFVARQQKAARGSNSIPHT